MIRLLRALFRLSRLPAYQEMVAGELPPSARFDPGKDRVIYEAVAP